MFLIERMIGIGTYLSILMFVCILIVRTGIKCKAILNFYLICLAFMGYMYKPYTTADLYRIFNTMDSFKGLDFAYFWQVYVKGSSSVSARILYWCIAQTGIKELLPMLAAFVSYKYIFYIIEKTRRYYSISRRNVAITLFFIMTTSMYLSAIGGIRMMLALSMISYCLFRESVENKFGIKNLLLYLVAFFLHNMAVIIIAIRIIVAIMDSSQKSIQKLRQICVGIGCGMIVWMFFQGMLWSVIEKARGYIFGENYYDIWEYIMGILILLLYLVTAYNYRGYCIKKAHKELQLLEKIMRICVIIAIVFCFEFSIFYRFLGHMIPILIIPICMLTLENVGNRRCFGMKRLGFKSVFLILMLLMMSISFARGSMSSLKFFVI